MADFDQAFARTLENEGGYTLTNDPTDRGGQTYAGISRRANPAWRGWSFVDAGSTPPAEYVQEFYRSNYWQPIGGDGINDQRVAENVYDFAVNAGVRTASKLAQIVCGAAPDGIVGPKTITALNAIEAGDFKAAYALAKLARYRDIVQRDRSQAKYLLGWINRILREAA